MTASTSHPSNANRSHRGESVVKDVLDATRDELARVGYRALRIEDVAIKANVNRTTIYRRWPTKPDLVRATLEMMFDVPEDEPDTGSLRGDLIAAARRMVGFLSSANGQVLIRMVMAEGAEPELRAIVDPMRCRKEKLLFRTFERAKARGEMRPDAPADLVLQHLVGGLHHRIFALGVDPTSIDVSVHVDLMLDGALAR